MDETSLENVAHEYAVNVLKNTGTRVSIFGLWSLNFDLWTLSNHFLLQVQLLYVKNPHPEVNFGENTSFGMNSTPNRRERTLEFFDLYNAEKSKKIEESESSHVSPIIFVKKSGRNLNLSFQPVRCMVTAIAHSSHPISRTPLKKLPCINHIRWRSHSIREKPDSSRVLRWDILFWFFSVLD